MYVVDLGGGLHLEFLHSVTSRRVDKMIAGISRHSLHLLFLYQLLFFGLKILLTYYNTLSPVVGIIFLLIISSYLPTSFISRFILDYVVESR